jgi:heme-degrading monooxygenase HmoA
MIAVIFEVEPAEGRKSDYLNIAAELRPRLESIDGFVSVERFQSLSDPDKILSLSVFENDEAVQRWRQTAEHRQAQSRGRSGVFRDYRLRVAEIVRDYSLTDRDEVPADSRQHHAGISAPSDRERSAP